MMAIKQSDMGWVAAQVALLVLVVLLPLHHDFVLPPPVQYSLLAVFIYGLYLLFAGMFRLGKNLSAFPSPKETGILKTQGVYRFVRHPMYGGIILAHFSFALIMGSLYHLLLHPVILLFFFKKALTEEGYMLDTYPEYAEYLRRTRRFIPFIV